MPGEESRLLDRNLVYTAITRSGCEFHLLAGNNALRSLLDAAPFLPWSWCAEFKRIQKGLPA